MKKAIGPGGIVVLAALIFSFDSSAPAQQTAGTNQNAQSTMTGRTNPAPWRPSFGPLNQPIATSGSSNQTVSGLPLPNSPFADGSAANGPADAPNATQNNLSNGTVVPPAANPTSGAANDFSDPRDRIDAQTGRRRITRVTKSMNQLPNDAGQVWREYDITPYTSNVNGVADPQQAILDWILKETGTEMWFNQPLGVLNADLNQLRVYHTPEIQQTVNSIVDRFVNTRGQVQNVQVSLVTVGKPNWRSSAYPVLQPIEVQSPGVEAWLMTKENASLLRASLARRIDFKDHGTGQIAHNDGQTVVLRNTRPVQFIRNFRWAPNQFPSYQPLITTIDEGYTLEISSLSSLDGNTIEASIQCHVDQVEKLDTVKVDVPGSIGATTDRVNLQIPQLVSWRLKERFRWQNDQVLLLSCGVVATPDPQSNLAVNLPDVLGLNRQRADALLFVDYRGPQLQGSVPENSANSRTVPVNPRR